MRADALLLSTLEDIATCGSPARRSEILARITGLFIEGAGAFAEQHIQLFDEIFNQLVTEIETTARFRLSVNLAPVTNAPPRIVNRLAHDDDICVANPVLLRSERLGESELVDLARWKSQGHLLAISSRSRITEPVTDVLVRRGDREVVRRVAENTGARLSQAGFRALVEKAEKDGVLAEKVSQREDIPDPLFRTLLLEATATVQKRLFSRATPATQSRIRRVLEEISRELEIKSGSPSGDVAERAIKKIGSEPKLDESALARLANEGDYEVTIAALAVHCKIPMTVVHRLTTNKHTDIALILCKAADLGWSTARAAILSRQKGDGASLLTMHNKQRTFEKLSSDAARDVVRHWQTLYSFEVANAQSASSF